MKRVLVFIICLLLTAPAFAKKDKSNKSKSLPPGLQKKQATGKNLPPGWQKKLTAGETLDYDLYDSAQPVSRKEEQTYRIPPSPAGTKLLKLENKIIRVMDATRTILDVFEVE